MKKQFTLILALVLAFALLTACAKQPAAPAAESGTPEPAAQPQSTQAAPDTESEAETGEAAPESYLDVSGVDFSSPSIVIQADDYDGMFDLAKKMQNFEIPADTVVEIYGEVGASMMSHSIVVPNEAGDQRVGTTFEFAQGQEQEVPADETPIHIVGVVRMNENYFNVLVVPAEHFESMQR